MGRMLSEAERAYLAGLIDADGAIMACIESHSEKKYGFRVRVVLKITQSNPKLLKWVREKTQLGKIRKNRTTYDWIVRNQKHIEAIIKEILKFLKGKERQGKIALKIIKSVPNSYQELIKIAQLADTLSSFNVRSKCRRKNYATKVKDSVPRND